MVLRVEALSGRDELQSRASLGGETKVVDAQRPRRGWRIEPISCHGAFGQLGKRQMLVAVPFSSLEAAGFSEEGHGVGEVLQGNDTDQASHVDNRDHVETATVEFAECLGKRVCAPGNLE